MADPIYRAVFSGILTQGTDRAEAMRRIGAFFRLSPETVSRLFSGSPMVVKRGIDRATAERYCSAFADAGAVLSVEPEPVITIRHREIRTVKPVRARGELAYSPLPCPSLGHDERGLALHRHDRAELPWDVIRLISVFADAEDEAVEPAIMLALFAEGARRPYLVTADHIRFHEFPDVAAGRLVDSLRRFAAHVVDRAPDAVEDIHTRRFLDGANIREIVNLLDFLTALGRATTVQP